MPDQQSTLAGCLHKARELRITQNVDLFILTKVPNLHEYRLVNCSNPDEFKLWLQKQTHKFACIIDILDILLIDSTLPFSDLHSLFGRCEALQPKDRTCIELTDFINFVKEERNAPPTPIPN